MSVQTFEIAFNPDSGVTTIKNLSGSCLAYKIPRDKMSAYLLATESKKALKRCGVYLLLSEEHGNKVYVGEADPVVNRMKQHLQNPQFDWKDAVVFVGTGNLKWTKSDIKYMEHGIYSELELCDNYTLTNGNTPQQSTVAHKDDLNELIKEMKTLIYYLGFPKLFVKNNKNASIVVPPSHKVGSSNQNNVNAGKQQRHNGRPTNPYINHPEYLKCQYSIGCIIGAVVYELSRNGQLRQSDVKYLLSPKATRDFKMRGNRYLKKSTGLPNEHKDKRGYGRFFSELKANVGGVKYLISTQLFPESLDAVADWMSARGYSIDDAVKLCAKYKMKKRPMAKRPAKKK